MRLKLLFTSILILSLAASAAFADEAAKAAKVEEFLKLANTEQILKSSLELMASQMKKGALEQLAGRNVPGLEKTMEQFQARLTGLLAEMMSWDKLKADFVKVYADTFSEAELDGMIAFYKSPAGRAMVTKTPELMGKSAGLMEQRMAGFSSEVGKLIEEYAAKVKESGKP